MNIIAAIEAYGTSDGASKAWDSRGRGRAEKESSGKTTKQERALASHVPMTKEKAAIAALRERAVASVIGGTVTTLKAPFDILRGKVAVEVKTIFPGAKNSKITMHKESLQRKIDYMEKNKITRAYTVILDDRHNKVYVAKGLGSFQLGKGNANEISSLKDLRNHIK